MSVTVFAFTLHLTLTVVWTSAEGPLRVIGSPEPIFAALGDDVILPCHLEPLFNVEGLTVEWSKPDLKPDPSDPLSRVDYVHLYRDRREDLDMKIQSYEMRTQLFTDKLKYGNVSLKIMNVTLEDGGRYRCYIPKLKSNFKEYKESIVMLIVEPKSVQTTTETPLLPRTFQTPEPKNETTVKGKKPL
ncbi:myelin-oligodendrocyte glycoprotein-like isoform X2 [Pagrus major]|uniref:myelin-oligodendrocyte glycoprotein-like isoform X2 n=1 Tax=Pagrus major TaxID=143350 RepID=UPI003CC875E4